MRVGIFGGSFNPPHMGHLASLQTVLKKAGLGQIRVVPAAQNPLKVQTEGPTPEQRLEMTRLALQGWGDQFVVDDLEIKRGNKSYTVDTIRQFRKTTAAEDLYLIIGMDKLHELDQWKDFGDILKEANLIVTSRPGFFFPDSENELPEVVRKQVLEFDFNFIELKTGRNIQFLKVDDVSISGTELRKWLRVGRNVSKYIPLAIETYIKEHGLYRHMGDKISDYRKFTEFCANALFARKAIQVRGYDLRKMSAPTEFALTASGTSTRHAASLAENMIRTVKEEYNILPQAVEGLDEGRWVVVDYGSLMVHIFYDFVRQEYSIENLWKEGIDLQLKDPHPGEKQSS
jgi:nicotinate-nucleotide adenylyltransferase